MAARSRSPRHVRPGSIRRRTPWKSRESVELAALEWVAWFNHQRLSSAIGYIPPAEAEANYYNQFGGNADEAVLL